MKKIKFFAPLAISILLAVSACGDKPIDPSSSSSTQPPSSDTSSDKTTSSSSSEPSTTSSSSSSSEPSTTSTSSDPAPIILDEPSVFVNEDKTGLNVVLSEHATKVEVQINDGEFQETDLSIPFESFDVGNYELSFVCVSDEEGYLTSNPTLFTFGVKGVSLDLRKEGNSVSFNGDYLSTYISFSELDEEPSEESSWVLSEQNEYTFTKSGCLGVKAVSGYDVDSSIYYKGKDVIKSVHTICEASKNLVVFDGNTPDIGDMFEVLYQENPAQTAKVCQAHFGYDEEHTTSADLFFKKNDAYGYYKYITTFEEPLDSYGGLSFYIKGNDVSEFTIQLKSTSLKHYIQYRLNVLSSNWTYYNIPIEGNWTIDDTAYTLKDLIDSGIGPTYGINLESSKDIFHYIDQVILITKPKVELATGNGCHTYIDEFTLVSGEVSEHKEALYKVHDSFSGFASDGKTVLTLDKKNENSFVIKTTNAEEENSLEAELVVSDSFNGGFILKTLDDGASLTLTVSVQREGHKLVVAEASGTFAPYLTGSSFVGRKMIYDFEEFESTGIGYDKDHPNKENRSELRGAFYSEYYAGSGSTDISGNNWSLMGSSDYLALETGESHGESGTKSAKFKFSSNDMRHSTWGLSDATANRWPSATKLSFWSKNPSNAERKVSFRFYETNRVTASVIQEVSGKEVTIAANSGWTQHIVDLNPDYTYYGMSISCIKDYSNPTAYILMDDFELLGNANPYLEAEKPVVNPLAGLVLKGKNAALEASVTFNNSDKVTVAGQLGGNPLDIEASYNIDENMVLTLEAGQNGSTFLYKGQMSDDCCSVRFTSVSGDFATYLDGLNLSVFTIPTGQNVIESFEHMSQEDILNKYLTQYDDGSGFKSVGSPETFLKASTNYVHSGFQSSAMGASIEANKTSGYKFRYKPADLSKTITTAKNMMVFVNNTSGCSFDYQAFAYFKGGNTYKEFSAGTIPANCGERTISGIVSSNDVEITGFGLIIRAKVENTFETKQYFYLHVDTVLVY